MAQKRGRPKKTGGFSEEPAAYSGVESLGEETLRARIEVGRSGRIVIPAAVRERMGIKEGSELVLLLKGEELSVFTPETGIRKAQKLFKMWDRGEGDIVDELLEDRRREAAEEETS